MLPEFEVWAYPGENPRKVIVRYLGSRPFSIAPGARLGGLEVAPVLTQPRALGHDRKPRFDLYLFTFKGSLDGVPWLPVGSRVFLEVPDEECRACGRRWRRPVVTKGEFDELRALLERDQRVSFVQRLRDITGLSLASAKAVLDHTDFHVGHCGKCDAPITPDFVVACDRCGAVTYPWHMREVTICTESAG